MLRTSQEQHLIKDASISYAAIASHSCCLLFRICKPHAIIQSECERVLLSTQGIVNGCLDDDSGQPEPQLRSSDDEGEV